MVLIVLLIVVFIFVAELLRPKFNQFSKWWLHYLLVFSDGILVDQGLTFHTVVFETGNKSSPLCPCSPKLDYHNFLLSCCPFRIITRLYSQNSVKEVFKAAFLKLYCIQFIISKPIHH